MASVLDISQRTCEYLSSLSLSRVAFSSYFLGSIIIHSVASFVSDIVFSSLLRRSARSKSPSRNEKLLNDPVRLRQISERIPAGRWGEPGDFAGPVVFLASDASQYVCGELLVVDGVRSISCS